jgi:hypothetical protein
MEESASEFLTSNTPVMDKYIETLIRISAYINHLKTQILPTIKGNSRLKAQG